MKRQHPYSPMPLRVLILVGVIVATSGGCRKEAPKPRDPLFSSVNAKYSLAVDFFGEWAGPDGDPKSQYVVDKVVLRKTGTGDAVEYHAADEASLQTSLGFFREVWSPDGEYLVLPRGRFQGFVIFAAGGAFDAVGRQQFTDSVLVRYKSQPDSVSHTFAGWAREHVLLFDGGLEGSRIHFSYDLNLKQLTSPSSPIPTLDALNSTGAAAISWAH